MSQLSVSLLRLGFLVLLWAMVLVAIGVLRSDLYGTRVTSRGKGRKRRARHDGRANKRAAPSRASTGVRAGAVSTQTPAAAHLAITSGTLKGTTVPLGASPVLIGRAATCTVVIEDDFLSARHCRIFPENDGWLVEDLGSTNGTYLNRRKVSAPMVVSRGDQVQIGSTVMEVS